MKNPTLFICGVPRSGTTLLQRMVDHHPEFAIANDSHFIPRALELTDRSLVDQAIDGRTIALSESLIQRTFQYHRFHRLGIDQATFEQIASAATDYADLVSGIYDQYACQHGKALGGEKTPDYLRRVELLSSLFPHARFIHIVRDGRDVALSLLDWARPNKGPGRIPLWQDSPVAVAALWWSWFIQQFVEQSRKLESDRVLTVRYESLVENPETQLIRICDFLQVDFHNAMLEEFERKRTSTAAQHSRSHHESAKKQWLPPVRGLRNWRDQMPPTDVELFEALAGRELEAMGYRLARDSWDDRTIEQAARFRRWWSHHFEARQRRDTSPRKKAIP